MSTSNCDAWPLKFPVNAGYSRCGGTVSLGYAQHGSLSRKPTYEPKKVLGGVCPERGRVFSRRHLKPGSRGGSQTRAPEAAGKTRHLELLVLAFPPAQNHH